MRTTVTIDDDLYAKALEMAKRLAALGGAMPEMMEVPRRREDESAP